MKVFGITGWKSSGKTTLVVTLVDVLRAWGYRVSTIKHSHHDLALDMPQTDSFRHRMAGASEVILATPNGFALFHAPEAGETDLPDLLARLDPVDLVLVEGFKTAPIPKLHLCRSAGGSCDLPDPSDPFLRALVTDHNHGEQPLPSLDLNDPVGIARFILRDLGLALTDAAQAGLAAGGSDVG